MLGSKRRILTMVAIGMLALTMGINAYAMPIHLDMDPVTVDAVEVKDAKALLDETEDAEGQETGEEGSQELGLQDFHLLGTADERLLIFAGGKYYTVGMDALPDVMLQLGEARIDALPDILDFEPINRGAVGDNVKAIQQALVDTGYLSASVDGQFGGKSQTAVSAFQTGMGLEGTGTADELTQMLILSQREVPVSIVQDYDPAMRYPELAGHTSANLSAIAEYDLSLDYDDIEGIGTLGNGAGAELNAMDGPDIDKRMFELEFMLRVSQNGGEIVIDPIVQVRCECVRRPIMQSLVLKAGDERCTVPLGDLRTELSGSMSIETATARLDEDALRVLANAMDANELKFRIKCKYSEYDGAADDLASIANIGKAGQVL